MIRVYTPEDLLTISKNDDVVLMNDLDFCNQKIKCIIPEFRGVLNGNGFTISNLLISDSIWGDEQKIALFTYISHAKIHSLTIREMKFVFPDSVYNPNVAALGVEVNESVIENVKIYVNTSNQREIPMLYETNGTKVNDLEIICNGVSVKPIKYKEGSLI